MMHGVSHQIPVEREEDRSNEDREIYRFVGESASVQLSFDGEGIVVKCVEIDLSSLECTLHYDRGSDGRSASCLLEEGTFLLAT